MTTKEFSIAVMAFVEAFHSNTQKEPSVARNDGGPGSGNFNHKGVEGQLGGSAPSGGGKYGGLSDDAVSIIKEHIANPYHFGESDEKKSATRARLASELKKAGIRVDYNEEHDTYSAMSTDLSYEANTDICRALNQSYYAFADYDRTDYVTACRNEGKAPKLSETPTKLDDSNFYTKSGKLQIDGTPVFSSLDKEKLLSNEELIKYASLDKDVNPEGFEKAQVATSDALDKMTESQRTALNEYTRQYSGANYSAINRYLVTGEGNERVQENAEEIRNALDHEIGVDCITSRGDDSIHGTSNDDKVNKLVAQISKGNFSNAGKLEKMLKGQEITNEAAMSTSPNDPTSNFGSLPVQYIFKTPADAKAVDITGLSAFGGGRSEIEKALANTGLFGAVQNEREVLYKPGTKYSIDEVKFSCRFEGKKKRGQIYLVCTVFSDQSGSNTDGRLDRSDEDPTGWITLENGQHIPLNESGQAIGGAGGFAKGKDFSKAMSEKKEKASEEPGLSSSMKPAGSGYDTTLDDDFNNFVRKNMGNRRNPKGLYKLFHDTEDNGGDGVEAVKDEYYKTRLEKCTEGLKEIGRDKADEILYDNLRSGTVNAWFREYNHEVKDALVYQMTQSPEVHNAALNVMYENYKYSCTEEGTDPLPFDKFLVTPIQMYRGGTGKEYEEASPFSSYTFSRKVAESFTGSEVGQGHAYDPNGVIYEAKIRPIDTYGSVYENGESEIMVPRMIAPNGNRDSADDIQRENTDSKNSIGRKPMFSYARLSYLFGIQ